MEMKINFNKLFDISDSDSLTPSTTSLQNSYRFDEPSILSNTSNHINLHYKFNDALFFDSQATMSNDQQINILGDLSSIGRSFEDSFEKQVPLKSVQKSQKTINRTPKVNKAKNEEQFFTKHTFGIGQKTLKTPGQRLYYEHKINEERRLRQVERLKMQRQEHEKKQITFKPAINENSKRILQQADSPLRKLENFKKSLKLKQIPQQIKSTTQKKYEEDLKNCTFHPTLTKTPKNNFTMNSLNERRNKDQVFEELYRDHRTKEIKRKEAELEQSKRQKKMTQEQLEQFLSRHDEYLQQKLHKEELMRAVSSQYDLSSGRKLFEPKINQKSEALISTASVKRFVSSSPSKKFILHEESREEIGFDDKRILTTQKSRSGKSRCSKSRSKKSGKSRSSSKKNKQFGSKKALFQKVAKNEQASKKYLKQKQVQKDSITTKNQQNWFKPLPYQVTKVENSKKIQKPTGKQMRQDNSKNKVSKGYERPSSTIFSKIKAAQSVFEQKNQEQSYKSERQKGESESINSLSSQKQQSKRSIDQNQSQNGSNDSQESMNKFGNEQAQKIYVDQTEGQKEVNEQYEEYEGQGQNRDEKVQQQTEEIINNQSIAQNFQQKYKDLYAQNYQHQENFEPENQQWKKSLFEQKQQNHPSKQVDKHSWQLRKQSEFDEQKNQQWKTSLFDQNQQNHPSKQVDQHSWQLRKQSQLEAEVQFQQANQSSNQYKENQLSETEEYQQQEINTDKYQPQVQYEQLDQESWAHQEEQNQAIQENNFAPRHSQQIQPQQRQQQQGMKSSFLRSISSNPQNSQKYQNLFDLGQEISRSHQSSPVTQRQSNSSDEARQSPFKLQIVPNFVNMINEPSDSHSSEKNEPDRQDVQDREQQEACVTGEVQMHQVDNQQKLVQEIRKPAQPSKKNWQEIFNSSAYGQEQPNLSQSSYSSKHKKTNYEPKQSTVMLHTEESPKKKPINIASLLKGKKKLPKSQQN